MDAQVEVLLKDQVNKEFYSAYLYLAFSNYYHGENLDGFGHWFEAQAREEQEKFRHAPAFAPAGQTTQSNSRPSPRPA